eukprot:gene11858-14964_t
MVFLNDAEVASTEQAMQFGGAKVYACTEVCASSPILEAYSENHIPEANTNNTTSPTSCNSDNTFEHQWEEEDTQLLPLEDIHVCFSSPFLRKSGFVFRTDTDNVTPPKQQSQWEEEDTQLLPLERGMSQLYPSPAFGVNDGEDEDSLLIMSGSGLSWMP